MPHYSRLLLQTWKSGWRFHRLIALVVDKVPAGSARQKTTKSATRNRMRDTESYWPRRWPGNLWTPSEIVTGVGVAAQWFVPAHVASSGLFFNSVLQYADRTSTVRWPKVQKATGGFQRLQWWDIWEFSSSGAELYPVNYLLVDAYQLLSVCVRVGNDEYCKSHPQVILFKVAFTYDSHIGNI